MTDVTLDKLIFEDEDEELFATYLAAEMSHLPKEDHTPKEETRK